ncbi:ABC transporter permease [Endomicrobium proavitum]|uniref:Aliphatic sulfonate ABC transporter (Permease) n=1 Tax=Endomicrobium proavitum TaxID=1408281 RepID=A0A0G3WJM4_9BACT|nr:ABC transporter permease subunit [Endomicrobium proavitum]AKL98062.1 aliphatic sulfonate ABC transporter (permease) [Endomicrobium proavitum]
MAKAEKKSHANIVTPDDSAIYWKPQSKLWFWLSIFSFIFAYAVDYFIPFKQTVNPAPYRTFLLILAGLFVALYAVSIKFTTLRKKLYHKSQFIFALGITLAAWDLLTAKSGIFPLPFFPGPLQIVDVTVKDSLTLFISTVYSLRLFFVGLIVGIFLGFITGILIGWYRQWDYWLSPVIKVSGVIPAVAWIPIAIAVFPNSFITGVFLIFIASWFSVSYMMAQGIASTPKSYFEVAKTLGADEKFLLIHVAIPNAVPNIFTGIMTATGLCFATLVVSEMIGAKAGLGWYINWAKGWSIYSKVYAAIIITAIAFSIILAVISIARSYLLRWQRGILK